MKTHEKLTSYKPMGRLMQQRTDKIYKEETDQQRKFYVLQLSPIIIDDHKNHLLPFWGTIKKSPSALQNAQLSIDLLAVYLKIKYKTVHQ